jgi:hypothetical protein
MGEALKIPGNIAVPPQPASLTAGTSMRPRPRKIFALLNQPLYINLKMKYQ